MRTPGTADCGVSEGVIGRVVSHGKHEPAVLCGDLAEQFALNPFEVNDGKRAARFRGGENVPRASGNCDLYGLDHGLAELVEIAKRGPVETGTFGGVVCLPARIAGARSSDSQPR